MTTTITREQFDSLAGQFDPGVDIRADYSGRSMYDRTCIGYVGDDPVPFALELAVLMADDPYGLGGADDIRAALDEMGVMRSDSMGVSTIWYWPAVAVELAAAQVAP